jgi:hypothetical protein
MTIEGLRTFILGQGSSKSTVQMEWDKIWSTNKKVFSLEVVAMRLLGCLLNLCCSVSRCFLQVIDPVAPRHTAIEAKNAVTVTVVNQSSVETEMRDLHPKNPAVGQAQMVRSPTIIMEQLDCKVGSHPCHLNPTVLMHPPTGCQ